MKPYLEALNYISLWAMKASTFAETRELGKVGEAAYKGVTRGRTILSAQLKLTTVDPKNGKDT